MKNVKIISRFTIVLIWILFSEVLVFAFGGGFGFSSLLSYPGSGTGAINFYRPAYSWWTDPGQSISVGWRTFWNESFDIFTSEYCKNITHTGETDIFIPTRTPAEWNSFKNRTNSWWITVSSCVTGTGCDINSGPICWTVCTAFWICVWAGDNFANECDMVAAGEVFSYLWVCEAPACNPDSGPVCASRHCDPKIGACTDVITYTIFANECVAEASWASLVDIVDISFCWGWV